MKASKMMMRSVLVGVSAAALFLLPVRSLGIGFTILEESNRRYVDGSYVPVPGLGVDYANIGVSAELIRIESRHNETFNYQGSDGYIAISGGGYRVIFSTDEPFAYEIQGSTVRRVSGPYEGSAHNDQGVFFSTGMPPGFSAGNLLALWGGNDSRTATGILPAGIYTVEAGASLDYYGNPFGFPYSFSAESGYGFSLAIRPLSIPDSGASFGLLSLGLVGLAVLRGKKAQPQT